MVNKIRILIFFKKKYTRYITMSIEEIYPEDESVIVASDFTQLSQALDELLQKEISGQGRQLALSKLDTAKLQVAYIVEALQAADHGTIEAVLRKFEIPDVGIIPEYFCIRKTIRHLLQKNSETTSREAFV